MFIFSLLFDCSIRPYLEKFTYEGDIYHEREEKELRV